MKKYLVTVIRWEPQTVDFEIEAENALDAKSEAVERIHNCDFEEAEMDNTRPIRTTVLRCNRIRKEKP